MVALVAVRTGGSIMATRAGPKARVHAHNTKNRDMTSPFADAGDHDDIRAKKAADIEG